VHCCCTICRPEATRSAKQILVFCVLCMPSNSMPCSAGGCPTPVVVRTLLLVQHLSPRTGMGDTLHITLWQHLF
jgi:hypothetical protein